MLEKLSSFLDRLSGLPYWQIAVLVIAVAGALVGGYYILRPAPRPAGVFQSQAEEVDGNAGQRGKQELTVHVAGSVSHPGVVLLEEGDRVIDAIVAAGGPLPEADLERLNLAQEVQDGQKITVPVRGTVENMESGEPDSTGERINLNTSSRSELEELPGIGPTLAERIIAYREKKGGFSSVEELKQVSGIGEKKFEELRDLVEI
ncbi:MAG: helix-hairpin-helix domain-containing protein [Actinobacteria bacterium]|nr:helix-hairpin-helix domain-containing protein [Actinomycetota bacterium]